MTPESEAQLTEGRARSGRRAIRLTLMGLAAANLLFAATINPPGHLTYDSGAYHFSVEALRTTGGFIVDNGWSEHPSPALVVAQLRENRGRLASQYPEGYTVLALPWYAAFGFRGLFLLNATAFLLTIAALFRLTAELFDRITATVAASLYAVGTFAWEWSQADYPHLTATALVVAAALCTARAWLQERDAWALAAGFVAGVAVTVRLDSAFALPAVFAPFLLGRAIRWRALALAAAGLVPSLAFLSFTNHVKFGTWSPFSYGFHSGNARLSVYAPVVVAGAVAYLGLRAYQRAEALQRRRLVGAVAAITAVTALALWSRVFAFLGQTVNGVFQLVVDMRLRDLDLHEPGLSRTFGGAMVYMDGVKKTLLQSSPWLVLAVLAVRDAIVRRDEKSWRTGFVAVVPATFLGFYGYLAWHGSVALNMRYLNPALPFLALLGALAWPDCCRPRSRAVGMAAVVALGLAGLMARPLPIRMQEILFLDLPLVIAALLLALEIGRRAGLESARRPLAALLVASVAWSAAVVVGRDWWTSQRWRRQNLAIGTDVAPLVRPGGLVFASYSDTAWALIGRVPGVEIARAANDGHASFRRVLTTHLNNGRPAYLLVSPSEFRHLARRGLLENLRVETLRVWEGPAEPWLGLAEVSLAQPAAPAASPKP